MLSKHLLHNFIFAACFCLLLCTRSHASLITVHTGVISGVILARARTQSSKEKKPSEIFPFPRDFPLALGPPEPVTTSIMIRSGQLFTVSHSGESERGSVKATRTNSKTFTSAILLKNSTKFRNICGNKNWKSIPVHINSNHRYPFLVFISLYMYL